MKAANTARQSFIFYLSIFLLMFLFEAQRFNVFFERKSTEIPELSLVGDYLEDFSDITGISFVTQTFGQITKDFSKEYIISSQEPIYDQLNQLVQEYAQYDFSKSTAWQTQTAHKDEALQSDTVESKPVEIDFIDLGSRLFASASASISEFFSFDEDNTVYTVTTSLFAGIDELLNANDTQKTDSDIKNASEANTGTDASADSLSASVQKTDGVTAQNTLGTTAENTLGVTAENTLENTSENSEKNQEIALAPSQNITGTEASLNTENTNSTADSLAIPLRKYSPQKTQTIAEPTHIQEALLDENMTAALLLEDDFTRSEAAGAAQANPENVNSDAFSIKEMLGLAERGNLYYNPKNSSPAPSDASLREYESVLPDYGKKTKVLIVGDSMMMEGLGPTLQTALRKRDDLSVVREGRYSSGLSRPDFYNWPENLMRLIQKHEPQFIIVSMGANDTQDIVINKKRFFIDSAPWERVYGIRTYNYLNIAAAENRQVLWVSLPVMGLEPYFTRTKRISKIQAEVSSYFERVDYVNIEHLLTKNGKYTSFVQGKNNKSIRLRRKDNIHVSQEGGEVLTKYVLPQVQENIDTIRYNEVKGAPMPPISGQANRVTFTSEFRKKETEYFIYLPKGLEENTNTTQTMGLNNSQAQGNTSQIQAQSEKSQAHNKSNQIQGQVPSIPLLIKDSMKSGEERFPVIYLLHGAYDSGDAWNKAMGKELQKIADEKRVIIVAPSSEPFGWYVNSPFIVQNQIESFLVKELVPHIDSLYPTTKKRALAGLSMGGHGAMLLGFKHPKTFPSVASISGVLDIRLHAKQWKIKNLLGDFSQNQDLWKKNSVLALIGKKWQKYAPQQILIVTGTEDKLVLEDNRLARDLLKKRQFVFEYEEHAGNHNWEFWTQHFPIQLRKQADYLHGLNQ